MHIARHVKDQELFAGVQRHCRLGNYYTYQDMLRITKYFRGLRRHCRVGNYYTYQDMLRIKQYLHRLLRHCRVETTTHIKTC